jgi:hypothetical protein
VRLIKSFKESMKRNEIYCNWPVLMIKEEWITGGIFDLPRSGLLEPTTAQDAERRAPVSFFVRPINAWRLATF